MKKMATPSKSVVVVGIGNILLRDEGIGVRVIEELKKFKLPKNVEAHDCGTSGIGILNLLDRFDKAIIVDAVQCGERPGTIYRFNLDEIKTKSKTGKMTSLHDLDFITALEIGRKTSNLPAEIVVIGVEPKVIEPGLEPSPEVRKAIPEVIHAILKEIEAL